MADEQKLATTSMSCEECKKRGAIIEFEIIIQTMSECDL